MARKAVFLDKDGTLVLNVPNNINDAQTVLLPGVKAGLKALREQGYELVIISNQAGIALGSFTEKELLRHKSFLQTKLETFGVELAGFYYCSHAQGQKCACRKPGTLLIELAARELDIDLTRSWFIGDILDDVEAGRRSGCRTVLINNGNETVWEINESRRPDLLCVDLKEAALQIGKGVVRKRDLRPANFSLWQNATNILCVRLDSLGDVFMTSPAIRALKQSRAGRRITLLTSQAGAAAAALNRQIDEVLVYEAPWIKGSSCRRAVPAEEIITKLRRQHFDGAVIFTVYSQSSLPAALLCHYAGIRLCLGYARESAYALLSDEIMESEPEKEVRHEVRRQLELVESIGAMAGDETIEVDVPRAAADSIERTCREWELDRGEALIVAHPGARAPSRRYDSAAFARALSLLSRRIGCRIVLTGTAGEGELLKQVRTMAGCAGIINAAGQFSLAEFAALLKRAQLLISNNTSAVHIASGVGTPVVDLYALTNPQHTPWQVPSRVLFHDVPCRFCYKSVCPHGHQHCLSLVRPEVVVEAALELLNREGDREGQAPFSDGYNKNGLVLC